MKDGNPSRACGLIVTCSGPEGEMETVKAAIWCLTGILRVERVSLASPLLLVAFAENLWTTAEGPADRIAKAIMALRGVKDYLWIDGDRYMDPVHSIRMEVNDGLLDLAKRIERPEKIPADISPYFVEELRTRSRLAHDLRKNVSKIAWGRDE